MPKHTDKTVHPLAIVVGLFILLAIFIALVKAASTSHDPAAASVPAKAPTVAQHVIDDVVLIEDDASNDTSPPDPNTSMDAIAPPDPYADWQYTGSAMLNDVDIQALRRALPLLDAEYRLKPGYDSKLFDAWLFESFRHSSKNSDMLHCVKYEIMFVLLPLDAALEKCEDSVRPIILEDDEVAALDAAFEEQLNALEESAIALADTHGD